MDEHEGKQQFRRDVFPCELGEIRKRRERLGLPELSSEQAPSPRLGLVGLALSGGGIRSATFSLGVIQALAKHGLFKYVDYLSTVSGGGFMGSCLSSVLNSKHTGPEQDRFPLHYQVGEEEPLGVGQLRNNARYLAPGGFLDKLRIPALVLRGVLSNLLIFLLIIFVLVLATELVYEVGQRLHVPIGYLMLSGLTAFLLLVVGFPAIARWSRGGSTWPQRNIVEMAFTVALLLLLFAVFMIPVSILVDQAIDTSWSEVRESVTANLLRPFEGRNVVHWLVVLGVLIAFMLAGRASEHVSRVGGKIMLIALGLLGPALLGTIYMALVVLEIDSPYVTPDELFSLDGQYAEELSDAQISPDLRRRFSENQIRLSKNAEVITLQEDVRWLLRDREHAFSLVRKRDALGVYPDFQDALSRGRIPRGLILSMERKGYTLDPITFSPPALRDNQFEISGSNRYWVNHDRSNGEWSLEQVADPALLVEVLQSTSYDLQISDAPSGTLIREDRVLLSDDDRELAIRFVEEGNPHDVVLVLDNSALTFEKPGEFRQIFMQALEKTLKDIRATVRMAVFLFAEDVFQISSFAALTRENKQALIQRLYGEGDESSARLDFEGQLSNSPAALVRALQDLIDHGRPGTKKSILLFSDGIIDIDGKGHDQKFENWLKEEFTEKAAAAGISLYGIALSDNARFGLFNALTQQTGGTFYPVFETHDGIIFEDVFDAMRKLKESAGGRLRTPLKRVVITDLRDGTLYTLTHSENGVRIRVDLQQNVLSPDDLNTLTSPVLETFEAQGIELSDAATIKRVGDGRWELSDPYRYTISRSDRKLKITPQETHTDTGFTHLLNEMFSSLWDDSADRVFFTTFMVLLVYWLIVDVNRTAAHFFYRDRLSKAYLFRTTGSGVIEHNDNQKLSDLNTEGSAAPYHLINVALNLQGTKVPSLRGRLSDFFVFSKCFTGSILTGFVETKRMEQFDGDFDLGTAMAISGAAAAPNMGVTTLKPLVFIMTLLNVRLGYWLPNPRIAGDASWLTKLGLRRGPGPKYVLKEAFGHVDARGKYVNLSDGGHIENLGIYELLRRRCKLIIAVDGEADPALTFGSLVKLQLYARLDMGIRIELDLDPIRRDASGLSAQRWILGKIHYGRGEVGNLLYIKSSVTGAEYEYVRAYRAKNPSFPHESTADQFFTEARFEAYRALGYQIGEELFASDQVLGEFKHLRTLDASVSESGIGGSGDA